MWGDAKGVRSCAIPQQSRLLEGFEKAFLKAIRSSGRLWLRCQQDEELSAGCGPPKSLAQHMKGDASEIK